MKLKLFILLFLCTLFPVQASANSLLERFAHIALKKASTEPFKNFREYLFPNELRPGLLRNLFASQPRGVLVSTGADRAFIAASLYENCEGLIGVDINPRVKAYNDFNMLLIGLAQSREDYLTLRATESLIEHTKENDTRHTPIVFNTTVIVDTIRRKLEESGLHEEVKSYFRDSLDEYAEVFYEAQQLKKMLTLLDPDLSKKACRDFTCYSLRPAKFFADANYLYDDELFRRLKKLVSEGKVMFVVGDINKLDEFSELPITCIDSSNIGDYVSLDFARMQFLVDRRALHIWAENQGVVCRYHSKIIVATKYMAKL